MERGMSMNIRRLVVSSEGLELAHIYLLPSVWRWECWGCSVCHQERSAAPQDTSPWLREVAWVMGQASAHKLLVLSNKQHFVC